MKKLLIGLLILSSCGKDIGEGPQGPMGPKGDSYIEPKASEEEQVILDVLNDENNYRLALGQTELSLGLSCTLYKITGGSRLIGSTDPITGITTAGTFLLTKQINQPNGPANQGLNLLPDSFKNNTNFHNLFKLVCSGQIVVTESDYYQFDLASDDGSLLYVGGTLVINNDGNHGVTNVTGTKFLRKGVHAFQIQYAQTGAGNQALVLKMNSVVLNPARLYH